MPRRQSERFPTILVTGSVADLVTGLIDLENEGIHVSQITAHAGDNLTIPCRKRIDWQVKTKRFPVVHGIAVLSPA